MSPQNTNSNYNFILQNNAAPKKPLFGGNKLMIFIAAALGLVIILIIFGLLSGGGKKGSASLIEPMGQAEEVVRVIDLESASLKDPSIISVSATAKAVMSSADSQISAYLKASKIKVDKKKLAAYKDTTTDDKLTAAAGENKLDSVFAAYLRSALSSYQQSIKTVYPTLKTAEAQHAVKDSYASTQLLLDSAPLKVSQ